MKLMAFSGRSCDVGFLLMFLKNYFGKRPIGEIDVSEISHVLNLLFRRKIYFS